MSAEFDKYAEYSKEQAVEMMKAGKKMTHEGFTPDEWVTMENGKILLEDGVRCHPSEFWRWRTEDYWDKGWSVFIEK